MRNPVCARVLLLLVMSVSFLSCTAEAITDQESLFLEDPIEETDTQSTKKSRINDNDT